MMQVITLLKTMLSRDLKLLENHSGKIYPRGLLQLNALRLADIFSDDSNFRSYITIYFVSSLVQRLIVYYILQCTHRTVYSLSVILRCYMLHSYFNNIEAGNTTCFTSAIYIYFFLNILLNFVYMNSISCLLFHYLLHIYHVIYAFCCIAIAILSRLKCWQLSC